MQTLTISSRSYRLRDFSPLFKDRVQIRLANSSKLKIKRSRNRLNNSIDEGNVIYGVNTGFGKLSDVQIEKADQELLQLNLIRSHATGIGEPLSIEICRAIMF